MKVKSLITASFVVFGLAASCTAAQADNTGNAFEPGTKTVSYSDLNLTSDKGAAVFYSRVKSASRIVCAQFDSKDMALSGEWQKCYNRATASAVAMDIQAKVTALYNAANKSRSSPRLASLN